MWYKEWRQARFKILVAIVTYTLITLYSVVSWLTSHWNNVLNIWLIPAAIATAILAMLGGMDAVSEEKDHGTLSFLLTRPLDRSFVYSTKLLVNLMWLCGIYGVFNLLVLGLSRIQPFTTFWSFDRAATLLLLILTGGIATTCYTAFVSIFARTVIETMVYSVLIALSLLIFVVIAFIFVDARLYNNSLNAPHWFVESPGLLVGSLILIGIALILYQSGRVVFNRQEF